MPYDNDQISSCTPHEPGGPPACYPGPHCIANVKSALPRPTRADMLALIKSRQA